MAPPATPPAYEPAIPPPEAELPPWEIEAVGPPVVPGVPSPAEAPPEVPPAYAPEPAPEEDKPFETEAMMENVRPEVSNPDDFKLPPEFAELMGEPSDRALGATSTTTETAPAEPEAPAPPAQPETESHEWPFEEAPPGELPPEGQGWAGGVEEEETPASWSAAAQPEAVPAAEAPAAPPSPPPPPPLAPQDITVPTGEDESITMDDGQALPPPPQPKASDDLNSFFFEEDVEKKEKDQKGDPDSFWE